MNLNFAFVAIIVSLSLFAFIYAAMPTDYFLNQAAYQNNIENAEVRERFEATELAIYKSFGTDTMVFDYSSIGEGPTYPDWETSITDRYLEVWWGYETIPDVGGIGKTFEIRDTEKRNFLTDYYVMLEMCSLYFDNGTTVGPYLITGDIGPVYGAASNMTLRAEGNYLSANIILRANGTDTIIQGWNDGTLAYDVTYEIDFEAMKPNAFMLIAKLLTFQNPDFGLPGLFGEIITYGISLTIWIIIALLAYTIITRLIPTIQGGIQN